MRSQQNNIASEIRQKLSQYYKTSQDTTLLFCFVIKDTKIQLQLHSKMLINSCVPICKNSDPVVNF